MTPRPTPEYVAEFQSASPVFPLDFDSLHDLTGPVNQICFMVNLILKKHGDALGEVAPLFEFVQASAHCLENLIGGLRTYSRIVSAPLRRQLCDMNAVLAAALVSAQQAIESSGALVVHDRLPEVECDFNQMAFAFAAMIDNSIKFRADPRPEINIAAARQSSDWIFSVRDNGMGIDPGYHARVFSVFKRIHHDAYAGSGVGLAIVRRIAELHGGRVWFESTPGQGATFFLALPGPTAPINSC